VKRRLPILALLGAWICANGALLDAVQVFAWARMFSQYARTMDAGAALSRTFDPSRPCNLCRTVSRARDHAKTQLPAAVENSGEKLILAFHQPRPVFFLKDPAEWEHDSPACVQDRSGPRSSSPPAELIRVRRARHSPRVPLRRRFPVA
jgi:hypothetical protein